MPLKHKRTWLETTRLSLEFLVAEERDRLANDKIEAEFVELQALSGDAYLKRRQLHPPPYLHKGECPTCGASGSDPCQGLSSGSLYVDYKHHARGVST